MTMCACVLRRCDVTQRTTAMIRTKPNNSHSRSKLTRNYRDAGFGLPRKTRILNRISPQKIRQMHVHDTRGNSLALGCK